MDCAEGTTRQFALQPPFLKPPLRLQNVNKIFVTHMHGKPDFFLFSAFFLNFKGA